ncbi:MAG TPA: NAD-dependent succinate-semialdehyde dehydrogenase [Verrucomicrobiae bacterium]|nr:NAD-dependent succinate-semialdehyde dehydrogenase [Verrucomicrobiae bacterium]
MSTAVFGSRGIASINPATGQVLRRFEPHTRSELERRLAVAQAAFTMFRRSTFAERVAWLNHAAAVLERDKSGLGRTMTMEMGKPIRAAIQEVEKCATACRFYAEHGADFLADEPAAGSSSGAYVRYEPLGPVLAVMPWNFPLWQVFRFAAPALMAGNVGLLKHASNVPQCALAIERIFREAGFPGGAFQTLLIGSEEVERLIEDPRVRAVTLTGSVGAGSKVAAAAGRQIKKTVLELGGSDPFIVMPSANLEKAIATAVQARTINNGQSCIAAKRFIVHREIADEFAARFVQRMAALKIGDPLDESTDLGPLATEEVVLGLQAQVEKTVGLGAKLLLGGHRVAGPGYFFEPTVLTGVPAGSPAYSDELFGPVASIFYVDDLDHAIRIANDTSFGLGASAWSNDSGEQGRLVAELEAGMVFINQMVASNPALPFGGIKQSGYGRELSHHGIREFVNIKTVVSDCTPVQGNRTE